LARNEEKLQQVALELQSLGVETIVYPFDFSRYDPHLVLSFALFKYA